MRPSAGLVAAAASILGLAPAHASVSDLGPGSPISTSITGLTGPLAFSPTPAAAIKEVVGKADMDVYFPNQNPATIASGVETLFGLSAGSLTLTLNDEHPTASPYSATVSAGFEYVAVHNATGELVFQYSTPQTGFSLSGYGSAFSNARFYSDGSAPVPEPATWALLGLGFAGAALAGLRKARAPAAASAA